MLLRVTNYIWGIILLVLIILSVNWAFISTDAPYYLSVARDINQGNVPYKDIYLSYTPLMMYLNSIIYSVFKTPSYSLFLSFQYSIIGLSSCLLYYLSFKNRGDRKVSFFLSISFFFSVLASDGTYINLEVYLILFVFLAYWLYQQKHYFLCGLVLSLSFFSKQYGILNFLPFTFLILSSSKNKLQDIAEFYSGSILVVVIFLFYFSGIKEVKIVELFLQLSGNGYADYMMGIDKSLFSIIAGAKIFLLLVIPLLFLSMAKWRIKHNLILLSGLVVNLVPITIQHFSHYFILTFPYIFLLFFNLDFKKKMSLTVFNMLLILIGVLIFSRIWRYRNEYEDQLKVAHKFEKIYPAGSEVFLYKYYRYLYILNDYKNPVLKEIGYRFEFEPNNNFRKKYHVISE